MVVDEGHVGGFREVRVVEQGGVALVDGLRQVHVSVQKYERQVFVAEVFAEGSGLKGRKEKIARRDARCGMD